MGCGQTKEKSDTEYDFEKGTLDIEVFKFLQLIRCQLCLKKYQYKLDQDSNNLSKFIQVMNSPLGGCVANEYNPLKEQIMEFTPDLSHHGRYYVLHNVLKQIGEPNFFDIWIIMGSITNPEHQMMMQSLHDLTDLKLQNWNKKMLYPFENKFLLYNDIAASLNGFARIIEFRCHKMDADGQPDPTAGKTQQQNQILSMTEGYIQKGRPEGYTRVINAFNGQTKLGYYQEGKPYGKWACFDIYGNCWQKKGLYNGQKRCIVQKEFDDFLINEEPIVRRQQQGYNQI